MPFEYRSGNPWSDRFIAAVQFPVRHVVQQRREFHNQPVNVVILA
jgi:hypothetical protein